MVPDVLIISLKVWNSLTDQEQQWLQQAANESVVKERELWAQSVKESLDAVKKAGVTIIYPDKEPFAEKVKPMYEMFRDQPRIYDLMKRIQATKIRYTATERT